MNKWYSFIAICRKYESQYQLWLIETPLLVLCEHHRVDHRVTCSHPTLVYSRRLAPQEVARTVIDHCRLSVPQIDTIDAQLTHARQHIDLPQSEEGGTSILREDSLH